VIKNNIFLHKTNSFTQATVNIIGQYRSIGDTARVNEKNAQGVYPEWRNKKSSVELALEESPEAIFHINASFHNTIVTFTDLSGNTKGWASCGTMGFKKAERKHAANAGGAAQQLALQAKELGISRVKVIVKGVGQGRESAIKALDEVGLKVLFIQDRTPIPHNGCKKPKKRRL